ncbi:Required for meiotic nuclear division protein 1 like protein [Daldinia childiae]|uniref:Required for meiotic nuclear division protein 1 like protein n=1 Tax=Daldinia childiae TaxID=326645 RepID=UPI0014475141|nr:Required for meiotic nuclear division protein 1 like protein [Daldinia childiae]KAF3059642.1 Required for meiotic nuclear division protein 1 like protein [Daldinia childiae]
MRPSLQKVIASTFRGLHTVAPLPRPQRCFHQTTFASLPRKRSFFTSNQLLANSTKDGVSTSLEDDTANNSETQQQNRTPAPKRKPVRVSAAKTLRLGLTTKPPQRTTIPRKDNTDSEMDYRRTITSICVAQSFDMEAVQEILRFHAFELDPDGTEFDPTGVVHARGINNGDIFVFPSGTVVAWSVPTDALMTLATKQLIRAAQLPHLNRLEMEELEFIPDESRDTSYMRGEVVVLGTRAQELENHRLDTTLAKIAFSSGLARSPKLAMLENQAIDYFENSKNSLDFLEGGFEHKLKRSAVLKMTGKLLSLRSQLNHYSDITDQLPDMFWDSESNLENYYNQISTVLDIRQRIGILNKKIDYGFENVSVLREMVSEKYGHRLEWIIIFLIAIEVLFELRRVYRESISEASSD